MAWGTGTWLIIIACCILLVAWVRRIRRVRGVNRELALLGAKRKAVRDNMENNLAVITRYGLPGSASGMTPAEEAASFPSRETRGVPQQWFARESDGGIYDEGGEMPSLLGEMPSFYPSNQSPAVPVIERWVNNQHTPDVVTDSYHAYYDEATGEWKFHTFYDAQAN
jgi:hypothetical protein